MTQKQRARTRVVVRKTLETIFWAAIDGVDPYKAVSSQADYVRETLNRGGLKQVVPIAFGKAACPMAQALYDSLPAVISQGMVVTKYGHCASTELPPLFKVTEAGHPVPDENSVRAAQAVTTLAGKQLPNSLIICLISGGGSSLLALPTEGISLEEKQLVTDLLLKAGACIAELNCVRKHISGIKGGRLAELSCPTPILSLIISDVIGDKPDVIASGPTAPDESSYLDARNVLEKYGVSDRVPLSILKALEAGIERVTRETPKKGDRIFDYVENRIIASNGSGLAAAGRQARRLGFQAGVLTSVLQGEARQAGKLLAQTAVAAPPTHPYCLLSGGETTVKVRGRGVGGRNTELALGFALGIQGAQGIYFLSAATDGDDNSTGATGAFVDGSTVSRAQTIGLDPSRFLENNDSHTFFKELGDLFVTGPTGTNVMDIQIILGVDQ